MNIAYKNISKIIEQIITQLYPNSQLIAKINQELNNYHNALDDLWESLLKNIFNNNWTYFDLFSKYFLFVLFKYKYIVLQKVYD